MFTTKLTRTVFSLLLIILGGAFLGGCKDKGKEITIRYDRQPQYTISDNVRKVAVVQFGAKSGTEERWGEIASDCLASVMDEYDKKFHRFVLIDRKRVQAIMEERDFQMSVADTDQAVQFGKIASVDAMIYGTVFVDQDEKIEVHQVSGPYGVSIPVKTEYRRSTAAVTFAMVDVQTTKTICSVTITKKYDSKGMSKEEKERYKKVEKNLPAITQMLIDECVREFVGKISPHEVEVQLQLEAGKAKQVKDGNNFASEGEYRDAIRMYQAALSEAPDDDGAMFNIGVCHEAMGQLTEAETWYNKAIAINANPEYIRARKRVRVEAEGEDETSEASVEANRQKAREARQKKNQE
ncbi:MAG: tetratricopeptide repeat protein [Phycisphaerae bacterium]|nr:tetratricopeptide repeat protein [Phycisphaerae bacterium]